MDKPTIFISYSRLDEDWLKRLAGHLGVAEKQGQLDHLFSAGESGAEFFSSSLNAASIVLHVRSAGPH